MPLLPNATLRSLLRRATCCLGFLLLGPLLLAPALAQPPTPGTVEESLRKRPSPTSRPRDEVSTPTAPKPAQTSAPGEARRVPVKRFAFTGNSLFSEEELQAVIAGHEGQELTLAEIYSLADALTDFYQGKGYSLTTVTVPAQRMQDGVLRFEVVEGRIGKLNFEGNRRYESSLLTRQLDLLTPGTILRFADLERQVLLLNDLPGLTARSVLVPGEEYGSTDINLRLEEERIGASATLDNQGRKAVGQWKLGLDFTLNNPGRLGDALGLGYSHSQDNLLKQGRFSYGLPVRPNGTRVNASYSRAEYDVGGEFSALGISGISETARLQLSHPLLRSRRSNLLWTVGGAHVRGQSDMDTIPLSDDTIDYLDTGLNYSRRNASGGQGNLSALLATNFRGNPDGANNEALPPRLELRGDYEYLFLKGWACFVHGETVWSDAPLPDSNKYNLGGANNVRGFVSAQARGDQGVMGSLELRRYLTLAKANLQLRGFLDAGEVSYHLPLADGSQADSLTSAGVGMTLSLAGRYSLDLQWATPIDGNDAGDGLASPLWMTFTAVY